MRPQPCPSSSPSTAKLLWYLFLAILPFVVLLTQGCPSVDPHPADLPAECMQNLDCDDGNPCNGAEPCVLGQCGWDNDAPEGLSCTLADSADAAICLSGACVESLCGDGILDSGNGEICDDANSLSGDGCDADCSFSCEMDLECDDGDPCNGVETCGGESGQRCIAGTLPTGIVSCGAGLVCSAGACVETGCQNGVVEPNEFCDDGNDVSGDGCEADCRFTCYFDSDCDDGNACNGIEVCDGTTNACTAGTAPDCASLMSPETTCEEAICEPVAGCMLQLIDHDGDGFASTDLGACGLDCDDGNSTIYPDAPEIRDTMDNDCNGLVDDSVPTWYADCDGDGYAAADAEARVTGAPSGAPASCRRPGASWTLLPPTGSDIDCGDSNHRVYPGAPFTVTVNTSAPQALRFDANCDGVLEFAAYPTGIESTRSCWFDGETCRGIRGWVDEEAPTVCGGVIAGFGIVSGPRFSRCVSAGEGMCTRTESIQLNLCR